MLDTIDLTRYHSLKKISADAYALICPNETVGGTVPAVFVEMSKNFFCVKCQKTVRKL